MFEKEIEELNKAIKHLENDILPSKCNGNISCYNDHLQLYRWIKELKSYKEIQAKNNEDIFEDYAEKWWQNEYSPHTYANSKEVWKDGAEFGYNKANEWHYPSKGELPKCDDKTQLIFYVNCYYEIDGKTITRKRTVLGYYQNSFLNDDIKLFVEKSKGYEDEHLPKDVIAWKEIVLPEGE